MKKIEQLKIEPSQIRVVQLFDKSGRVFFYRDQSLFEELDSLGRPTGVFHAVGLAFVPGAWPWKPCAMTFATDTARPACFEVPDESKLRFIIAGILLGERYHRITATGKMIRISDGRLADRAHAISVWRKWLQWIEAGRPPTAARFILGKKKLRFGEDEPIAKTLQRLGLPFS